MSSIISFVHISLDGFVAGPNGEMNWIILDQDVFDHVGRRIGETDTALYGRVTYQMMEAYWPTAADKPNATRHDKEHSAWYSRAHRVVLSHSMKGTKLPNTTIINDNLEESIHSIKEKTDKEILLFGSPTATHALMERDLIDGYWLFVNPVLLGRGIPLFQGIQDKTMLRLQSTRSFDCGVTELSYTVSRQ